MGDRLLPSSHNPLFLPSPYLESEKRGFDGTTQQCNMYFSNLGCELILLLGKRQEMILWRGWEMVWWEGGSYVGSPAQPKFSGARDIQMLPVGYLWEITNIKSSRILSSKVSLNGIWISSERISKHRWIFKMKESIIKFLMKNSMIAWDTRSFFPC